MTDYTPEGIPDTPLGRYVNLMASLIQKEPDSSIGMRGAIPLYDKATKAAVVARYAETKDVEGTAKQFGVSDWTVRRWAAKAGEYKPQSKAKYTDAQWAKVRSLMEAGHSISQTARLTGIPKGTIQHWRHKS